MRGITEALGAGPKALRGPSSAVKLVTSLPCMRVFPKRGGCGPSMRVPLSLSNKAQSTDTSDGKMVFPLVRLQRPENLTKPYIADVVQVDMLTPEKGDLAFYKTAKTLEVRYRSLPHSG
jgi:hypothetical protein